jgi:hypothetical protein
VEIVWPKFKEIFIHIKPISIQTYKDVAVVLIDTLSGKINLLVDPPFNTCIEYRSDRKLESGSLRK